LVKRVQCKFGQESCKRLGNPEKDQSETKKGLKNSQKKINDQHENLYGNGTEEKRGTRRSRVLTGGSRATQTRKKAKKDGNQ